MVRTKSLLAFLVFFGLAVDGFAASNSNLQRGGLGFLFPDHNSFSNPGQFGAATGTGLEAYYGRDTASGPQVMTPSLVYGNGMFGLGAYASRSAAVLLSDTHSDTAGVGMGAVLLKGRVTLGAGYEHDLSSSGLGDITGTLTMNSPNRQGLSLGVAYTRGLASGVNSMKAGLGYSFMSNNNVEFNFALPDLTSMANFNLGAYFTTMKGMVYLSGGYVMTKAATTIHGASGRLGFMLGQNVDLSAWANYFFVTSSAVYYGGTLRFAF